MAEFTEQQVYEALGLGAKEQEPAAPAPGAQEPEPQAEPATGGAKEQEPAAPASQEEPPAQEEPEGTPPAQEPEGGSAAEEPAQQQPDKAHGQQLTEEQRKENAARRRREETQAAIDKAVQDAVKAEQDRSKAEMDAFFAAAALKNTLTGKPITNMEEFNEWKQAFDAAKLQRDLKTGKLTPEGLQKVIEQTPAMKQVQQIAQKQEEAARQQSEVAAKARVDAEIAEIHKLDPTISEVKDLLKMPTAKEFYALVKKGNSFLDAFRLANYDRLTTAAAEAAKQQAMNNARSKDHLTGTGPQRGQGSSPVPPDEMAMFRLINPGATDAEIQAYYNKNKK
jgi:hypothetical protein